MRQVMASQKQLEVKYHQAQQTAVRTMTLEPLCSCTDVLVAMQTVSAAQERERITKVLPYLSQDEWYRRAELALNKGDDDLAREALKRRKAYAVRDV